MYFLKRKERCIEELLHWWQTLQSSIQDEESCKHWFTHVFFYKLKTSESLNYPVYLNVVQLVFEKHLYWKFVLTGEMDPSDVFVEI